MDPFVYKAPSSKQLEVLNTLRSEMRDLANHINLLLPPGRCRSLAITKLEECSMWANKACVFELPQFDEGQTSDD